MQLKQMSLQLNAIEPETQAEADTLPFEVMRRIDELKAKIEKLEASAVDTPLTYVQMNFKEQDDAYSTALAFMSGEWRGGGGGAQCEARGVPEAKRRRRPPDHEAQGGRSSQRHGKGHNGLPHQ